MKGLSEFWIPYLVSNIVAVAILLLAIWRPRVGRLLLALVFGVASLVNAYFAQTSPEFYVTYADMAVGFYSQFISGWFSRHVAVVVSLIALGQLFIAVGMVLREVWVMLACVGAIVFLMAIAPLGVGSAFPFSLIVSAACIVILARDRKQLLWKGWFFNHGGHGKTTENISGRFRAFRG